MSDIEQRLREAMDGVTPGPWRVLIDDDGNPLSGRPSVSASEELDCAIVHWDGFVQQYWRSARGDKEIHANAAYIALCSPDNIGALLDTIASLRSKLEEAEGALEPFALVAEYDIGDSESDEDIFRPMDGRNSIAGLVRVGHLRAARRTLASLREADHA